MAEEYLKSVDLRSGSKTRGKTLEIFCKKNNKYFFVSAEGELVESPRLKQVFENRVGVYGKLIPIQSAEAEEFISIKKTVAKKEKKSKTEDIQLEE